MHVRAAQPMNHFSAHRPAIADTFDDGAHKTLDDDAWMFLDDAALFGDGNGNGDGMLIALLNALFIALFIPMFIALVFDEDRVYLMRKLIMRVKITLTDMGNSIFGSGIKRMSDNSTALSHTHLHNQA